MYFFHNETAPSGPSPHYGGFTITLRHTTISRTPLDEQSARRRDLCLTIHNTYKRLTSMAPTGSEPAMPARELLQTHAIERAASRIASTLNTEGYTGEQRIAFVINDA